MKRLIAAVVIATSLWSGYWFVQSRAAQSALEGWFDARRAEGWTASYESLKIHGFPNRIDARFKGIKLANPETGQGWDAPSFEIRTQVYDPDHRILVFPERQVLRGPSGDVTLSAQGFIASVNGENGMLTRAGIEADTLNIDAPQGSFALAGVNGGIQTEDASPETLWIGLTADAVAGDAPVALNVDTGSAKALDLRAALHLDAPWPLRPEAERPAATRLDLKLAEYRLDQLWLRATGDWDIDHKGRLDGDMTLRAENWRGALDQAIGRGDLPAEIGRALSDALGLVSQLSGNRDALDLKLGFNDGRMSMGLIPLGDAPRLRSP